MSMIDDATKKAIFDDINCAMNKIAEKHGLVFESSKFKEKINVFEFSHVFSWLINGINREQREYIDNAEKIDLKKEWISIQVNYNLNRYEIKGLNLKRYKNPVKVHNYTSHKTELMHPDKVREIWTNGKLIARSH